MEAGIVELSVKGLVKLEGDVCQGGWVQARRPPAA